MVQETPQTVLNSFLILSSVYFLTLILVTWKVSIWRPFYRFAHFLFTVFILAVIMLQIILIEPYGFDVRDIVGYILLSDYANALMITVIFFIVLTNGFSVLRRRIFMNKLQKGVRLGDPLAGFPSLRKKFEKIKNLQKQQQNASKSSIRKLSEELCDETVMIRNNYNKIIKLLGQGASVQLAIDEGRSVLFYLTGRRYCMKYQLILLFKALGADFDKKDKEGRTPLSYFVWRKRHGQSDMRGFEALLAYSDLNAKDKEGQTALMYEPEYFDFMKKKLIERGADLNVTDNRGKTAMNYATKENNEKFIKALKKSGIGVPTNEDEQRRKRNLSAKAQKQLNEDLLYIAQYGDSTVDEIQEKLDDGADINATDEVGNTALIGAAEYGNYTIVEKLIDEGASLNNKNESGQTALHLAVNNGYVESVSMLLEAGCAIDDTDSYGTTPLMVAAQSDESEIIKLLLQFNARKDIQDNEGKTALDYAKEYECKEGVKLLK